LFAVDGVLKGVIPYADKLRSESSQVVRILRKTGVKKIVMITGDNDRVARAVADELGIQEYFAEVLPASKAELVKALQQKGHIVGMVGDGINDSPALAYGDVGVALRHGAKVACETADVVLMEDNLARLITAINISRDAIRTIHQNYAIIAGLNTLALPLTIPPGWISPNMSALISNGSAMDQQWISHSRQPECDPLCFEGLIRPPALHKTAAISSGIARSAAFSARCQAIACATFPAIFVGTFATGCRIGLTGVAFGRGIGPSMDSNICVSST
jgi:soluble P-type ATPase